MNDVPHSKTTLTRTMRGKVISNRAKDSVVILIESRVKHAKYGKILKRSTKVHAHDPGNKAQLDDIVTIKLCRPVSKKKSWVLLDIVERIEGAV